MLTTPIKHRASPSPPGSSLSLILVVDRPKADLSAHQVLWLQQLQDRWLRRVRVRFNETNMGASATRNRGLQVCLSLFVLVDVLQKVFAQAGGDCICCC